MSRGFRQTDRSVGRGRPTLSRGRETPSPLHLPGSRRRNPCTKKADLREENSKAQFNNRHVACGRAETQDTGASPQKAPVVPLDGGRDRSRPGGSYGRGPGGGREGPRTTLGREGVVRPRPGPRPVPEWESLQARPPCPGSLPQTGNRSDKRGLPLRFQLLSVCC